MEKVMAVAGVKRLKFAVIDPEHNVLGLFVTQHAAELFAKAADIHTKELQLRVVEFRDQIGWVQR